MSATSHDQRSALLRADDARARALAVTRFDAPLALEAGAGTGKTTTLVARIVAWCLGPGWDAAARELSAAEPAQIARQTARGVFAITFTEAAAAEMATRSADGFAKVARGEELVGLPDDTAASSASSASSGARDVRASHLLAAVDLIEIGTIHSFCGRILRDQSLALGLHPSFEIDADGEATAAIARSVVATHWPGLLESGDPRALALARRGVGAQDVAFALGALASAGVEAHELVHGDARVVEALLAAFQEATRALLAVVADLPFKSNLKKPQVLREALIDWLATPLGDDPLADLDRARTHFEGSAVQAGEWRKGGDKIQKGVRDVGDAALIQAASERWCDAHDAFATYDAAAFGAAAELLAPLVQEARERRRREGWLAFDDLLSEAAAWARNGGPGVDHWRARIRQLLVDEFQDTDTRQCDLVAALAFGAAPAPRPGLFVVGDPKQSIYGWRAADLAAYEGLLERLVQEGGEKHTLSINFRSSQAILDEVERVLTPHLVHEPGVQAAFAPLVVPEGGADRPPPAGAAALEYWTTWDVDGSVDAAADADSNGDGAAHCAPKELRSPATTAREAVALAQDVLERRAADSSLRLADIAVLMRTTTDQEVLLRALRDAGVPFTVAKERSFWHHREVRDAALFLCAVLDPKDDVALVAWLRSPHTGMPDGAFAPVWKELAPLVRGLRGTDDTTALARIGELVRGAAAQLAEAVRDAAPSPHWPSLVCEQITRLAALRAAWRSAPLTAFMAQLRLANAASAGEAARRLGRFRTANLDAFHARFEERVRATSGDTLELLRFLRAPREERADADQQRPEGDAVLVSTIHGAKGLEFRVVYLVNGHKKARTNDSDRAFATRARRDPAGLALQLLGFAGLGWKSAARRAQRVAQAEQARLLYVALTRAKARLVIAASAEPHAETKSGVPGSFAHAVVHRRPADLEQRFVEAARGGASASTDEDGVLWRFTSARAPQAAESSADQFVVEVTRARADAERLAAARAHAALSNTRPSALPASSDLPRDEPQRRAEVAEVADAGSDATRATERSPTPRLAAAAAGTRIHLLLAQRVAGDTRPEIFDEARAALTAELAEQGDVQRAALARFDELAAALTSGPLLTRLDALVADPAVDGPHCELPILLSAADTDTPTSHYTGAADLVFRDAAGWCVVDFKTDRLATPADRAARAAHYAPQLARYAEALQRALALPAPPRRELWWVEGGAIDSV